MAFRTRSGKSTITGSAMLILAVITGAGCVAFDPAVQSEVEDVNERPYVALLPFGFDLEITKLSTVKTVEDTLSPEDEAQQLAHVLHGIEQDARWLLLSRLAVGRGFRFVPLEQTDALAEELDLQPGAIPSAAQLAAFRDRLGADLVLAGSILDYGKIRWQWALWGLVTHVTVESIVVGFVSGWNPVIVGTNAGLDLLTEIPIWFGGTYLFGVALRPVRVEARAFETVEGYPIWQMMDESAYAWEALKLLPESVRDKKESQLTLNLAEIMESFGDELTQQGLTTSQLRNQSEFAPKGSLFPFVSE